MASEEVVSVEQLSGQPMPLQLELLEKHSSLRSSVAMSDCVNELLERFITQQSNADEQRLAELLLRSLGDIGDLKASLKDAPRTTAVLLACVACDVLSISDSASALLVRIVAADVPLLREVVRSFRSCSSNSEVACRVANLMSQLVQSSELGFLACVQTGAVDCLLELSRTDDVLLQGVAMDYLASLGHTNEGLKVFTDRALPWLLEVAAGEHGSFLRSAALRVVANTLVAGADLHGSALHTLLSGAAQSKFISAILLNLESPDVSCRISAINCIAMYCTSPAALKSVLANKALLALWLQCFRGTADLQVAAMNSVSVVLFAPSILSVAGETLEAGGKKAFFDEVRAHVDKLVPFIVQAAKRPFADVKHAAFNLLSAIASAPWGVAALMGAQGFGDFITDMATENSLDGKHWKFRVLKTLYDNDMFRTAPTHLLQRFEVAVARGPLYVGSQVAGPTTQERGN